jgi:hypothetical protein
VSESSRWCPSCGAEYLAHVEVCAECGVALADTPPPPPAPVDHDTVTYDFAGEGEGQRRVVELLLRGAGIAFSWDNDDLVVPQASEATVDQLLEELDAYAEGPAEDESIAIELGARTLKRVGLVMQYLGGIGLLVALIEAISTLDSLADDGFANGGALQKVAFVLGAYTFVLFSALVIGLGGLCRLFADWVLLRLPHSDIGPSRRSESGP